jgi:ankyrin repeat protein
MNQHYINDPDAIVWATHYANVEEFEFCLKRGDDLDVQDDDGRSALHAAAEEGWSYYAEILIQKGADVEKKDKEGDTPLDYAIFYEHQDVEALLTKAGAKKRIDESAKKKMEDSIYDAFSSADAVKRIVISINKTKGPNKAG